jgi:hypothetical protein
MSCLTDDNFCIISFQWDQAAAQPGIAGCQGAGLHQQLQARAEVFQGIMTDNGLDGRCTAISGEQCNPDQGIGLVLMGSDGLPAPLMWIHVNNVLIHVPMKAKCE